MTTLTIPLAEEQLRRLQELARAVVEEWLSRPDANFARAAEYVLNKNRELYRRLA